MCFMHEAIPKWHHKLVIQLRWVREMPVHSFSEGVARYDNE